MNIEKYNPIKGFRKKQPKGTTKRPQDSKKGLNLPHGLKEEILNFANELQEGRGNLDAVNNIKTFIRNEKNITKALKLTNIVFRVAGEANKSLKYREMSPITSVLTEALGEDLKKCSLKAILEEVTDLRFFLAILEAKYGLQGLVTFQSKDEGESLDKALLLKRLARSDCENKIDLDDFIVIYRFLGLRAEDLVNTLPFMVNAFPEIRTEKSLKHPLIWKGLCNKNPLIRREIAVMLCIDKPSFLATIRAEKPVEKLFTSEDWIIILARVFQQAPNTKAFEVDPDLNALFLKTLKSSYRRHKESFFDCLKIVAARDVTYFTKVIPNLHQYVSPNSPLVFSLLRESGMASDRFFFGRMENWSKQQQYEYLEHLIQNPQTRNLFLNRVHSANKLSVEKRTQLILNNLDKIPLQSAIEAVKLLGIDKIEKSKSILVNVFRQCNLMNIKSTGYPEHKKINKLIRKQVRKNPQLNQMWGYYCTQLPLNQGKWENFTATKGLISFAYFLEKYSQADALTKENICRMLTTTGNKKTKEALQESQVFLSKLLQTKKPDQARYFLTDRFVTAIGKKTNPKETKKLKELLTISDSQPYENIIALQMSILFSLDEIKIAASAFENGKYELTRERFYQILEVLELINREPILSNSDKKHLVQVIMNFISEKAPVTEKKKEELVGYVISIIKLGGAGYLSREYLQLHQESDALEVVKEIGGQCLQIMLAGNLDIKTTKKVLKELGSSRDPNMLGIIVSKLNEIRDNDEKERHFIALADTLSDLVAKKFSQERYQKSPHLNAIKLKLNSLKKPKFDLEKWQGQIIEPHSTVNKLLGGYAKTEAKDFEVYLSDDFVDLCEVGTEVIGSCLSLRTGKVHDVKTLMGYVIDGKTRVIVAKEKNDPSQPIQGVSFMRLLWDEKNKTPAILFEGIYLNKSRENPEAKEVDYALFQATIQVAKELNIPLVGWGSNSEGYGITDFNKYPSPLSTLAKNRNPKEKCDTADVEGVNTNGEGKYTIPPTNTKVIWHPT